MGFWPGLPMLAGSFGDLSGHDLDGPLPTPLAAVNAVTSGHEMLVRVARQEGMTIHKLYQMMAGASWHKIIVGTAGGVADFMED